MNLKERETIVDKYWRNNIVRENEFSTRDESYSHMHNYVNYQELQEDYIGIAGAWQI